MTAEASPTPEPPVEGALVCTEHPGHLSPHAPPRAGDCGAPGEPPAEGDDGPWTVHGPFTSDNGDVSYEIQAPDSTVVAICDTFGEQGYGVPEKTLANALTIAAARSGHDGLRELREWYEQIIGDQRPETPLPWRTNDDGSMLVNAHMPLGIPVAQEMSPMDAEFVAHALAFLTAAARALSPDPVHKPDRSPR